MKRSTSSAPSRARRSGTYSPALVGLEDPREHTGLLAVHLHGRLRAPARLRGLVALLDQQLQGFAEGGASRGGVTGIGRFSFPLAIDDTRGVLVAAPGAEVDPLAAVS